MRKTKRVTIKDIAELAGVSKATASLVLNGRGKELRVAQETRERVLSIAQQQHYQPSIHARSLRDNRSHTIGLVVLKSLTTDLQYFPMNWKHCVGKRASNSSYPVLMKILHRKQWW